jgi:hypothetical protein
MQTANWNEVRVLVYGLWNRVASGWAVLFHPFNHHNPIPFYKFFPFSVICFRGVIILWRDGSKPEFWNEKKNIVGYGTVNMRWRY